MQLLRDPDVERLATRELVTTSMRRAVVAAYEGRLLAPPRAMADLGDKRLAVTAGRMPGEWFGYRSYTAPGDAGDDQVVLVQDDATGAVRGLAVGQALGPRRVAGIGAVAMDLLAPEDAGAVALVGAGRQAWHQLWALPDRLRGLPVLVASRTPSSRDALVARARDELGLDARAVADPAEATRAADVVVLATSSRSPVVTAADVRPGAYVATLGPKQVGRAEFAPELATEAALVVTDSPAQVAAYDPPNVLAGSGIDDRLVHLGALVAGAHDVPEGARVFFSVGLAGTEAWLLADLLAAAEG